MDRVIYRACGKIDVPVLQTVYQQIYPYRSNYSCGLLSTRPSYPSEYQKVSQSVVDTFQQISSKEQELTRQ